MTQDRPPPRSAFARKLRDTFDFVFESSHHPRPAEDWPAFFHRRIGHAFDHRLVLEIGTWDASLLMNIAERQPTTAYIGIDWKYRPLLQAAQAINDRRLNNIALLRGRAQDLPKLFQPAQLSEIWLFHPDPCDKPNELPNRLVSEQFLLAAHTALKPAGRLAFKTDHPGYYQHFLALLDLPDPPWFEPARQAHALRDSQRRGKPSPQWPRTKAKEIAPPHPRPAPSQAVLQKFQLILNSTDFWNDPLAQSATATHDFATQKTPFESRFVQKHYPIYYLELKAI